MEELFPNLKDSLNKAVEITEDEKKLLIELKVKRKILIPGDLGSPNEVKEMIKIFGGVKEDIQMEINVDEKTQIISLKFMKKEDYKIVSTAMKQIWDCVSEFLIKAFNTEPGKVDALSDLGNFDETY